MSQARFFNSSLIDQAQIIITALTQPSITSSERHRIMVWSCQSRELLKEILNNISKKREKYSNAKNEMFKAMINVIKAVVSAYPELSQQHIPMQALGMINQPLQAVIDRNRALFNLNPDLVLSFILINNQMYEIEKRIELYRDIIADFRCELEAGLDAKTLAGKANIV